MKISVFGAGYVGLVTACGFAEAGHTVFCVDVDSKKINDLNQGHCPIYEPGLEKILQNNIRSKRLHFSNHIHQAVALSELLFITVGTPVSEDGSADVLHVFNVIEQIIFSLKELPLSNEKIIVLKSTVPVGTFQKVQKLIPQNVKLKVCSNPEFLRQGSAVNDCLNPYRVILGVDDLFVQEKLVGFYKSFVKNPEDIIVMDPASSEITKYAANAMLATRISLMNQFSQLCEKTNANIKMVEVGIGSDPRIGPAFLKAGLGYGGSCFPKDLKALSHIGHLHNEPLEIISAVESANELQKRNFLNKIKKYFRSLKDLRIAIWGTSFKPETDDIRESPSLFLIRELLILGAQVHICDPRSALKVKNFFSNENLHVFSDAYECLNGVSAVILATEWEIFLSPDLDKMKSNMKLPVIFDGRNALPAQKLKESGFVYYGVGLS